MFNLRGSVLPRESSAFAPLPSFETAITPYMGSMQATQGSKSEVRKRPARTGAVSCAGQSIHEYIDIIEPSYSVICHHIGPFALCIAYFECVHDMQVSWGSKNDVLARGRVCF